MNISKISSCTSSSLSLRGTTSVGHPPRLNEQRMTPFAFRHLLESLVGSGATPSDPPDLVEFRYYDLFRRGIKPGTL